MWIKEREGKKWLQKREKGRKSAQKGGKTGKGRCGKRVDERCGTVWKKRGDVEKKTGRSERRYGEREKKRTERENSTEISTMWKRPSRDTDISTCRERKKTSRPVQRDG